MSECEHELNLVDENWMSENSVMVTAKCDVCKSKFRGLLVKDTNCNLMFIDRN